MYVYVCVCLCVRVCAQIKGYIFGFAHMSTLEVHEEIQQKYAMKLSTAHFNPPPALGTRYGGGSRASPLRFSQAPYRVHLRVSAREGHQGPILCFSARLQQRPPHTASPGPPQVGEGICRRLAWEITGPRAHGLAFRAPTVGGVGSGAAKAAGLGARPAREEG